MTTYRSNFLLQLGHVPVGIDDPVLYEELLAIHNAIEILASATQNGTVVTSHDLLTGVTPDQHHNKAHAHDGVDGSGQVDYNDLINTPPAGAADHDALTGVTANQHHNEIHTLGSHSDVVGAPAKRDSLTYDIPSGDWIPDLRNRIHLQPTMPLDAASSIGDVWIIE